MSWNCSVWERPFQDTGTSGTVPRGIQAIKKKKKKKKKRSSFPAVRCVRRVATFRLVCQQCQRVSTDFRKVGVSCWARSPRARSVRSHGACRGADGELLRRVVRGSGNRVRRFGVAARAHARRRLLAAAASLPGVPAELLDRLFAGHGRRLAAGTIRARTAAPPRAGRAS